MPPDLNRTIACLAVLKVNWDARKRDHIENFIPLLANLIYENNYVDIDTAVLIRDFTNKYGLAIPSHPMREIINRMQGQGLIIARPDRALIPNRQKIIDIECSDVANEQLRCQEKILKSFTGYCQSEHGTVIADSDAEDAMLAFLKEKDWRILFAADQNNILPKTKSTRSHRYLFHKYVMLISRSEPELFRYVRDIAAGHLLACTIAYSDMSRYMGKYKEAVFYLDVGVLMNLLNINGPEMRAVSESLLKQIHDAGGKCAVFKHTIEEIKNIFSASLKWTQSPALDLSKSSRATIYFLESGKTPSDIHQMIEFLERDISSFAISILDVPASPARFYKFQIDERQLEDAIVKTYRETDPKFNEYAKYDTLLKDIRSISGIYKLRGEDMPSCVSDLKHVFLTSNAGLALANRRFEKERILQMPPDQRPEYLSPATFTDQFIGTMLWLQSPITANAINERAVIAHCYAGMKPDSQLLRKYVDKIEDLKKDNKISSEQYLVLRGSTYAHRFLIDHTQGDPENVSPKTPLEVWEAIQKELKRQSFAKIDDYERKLAEINEIARLQNAEIEKLREREMDAAKFRENRASKHWVYAGHLAKAATLMLSVFLFSSFIYGLLNLDKYSPNKYIGWMFKVVFIILSILCFWFGFVPNKLCIKFHESLKKWLFSFINKNIV